MSIAIRAEHLSKVYRLGVINHGMLYKDLQSQLARWLGKPDPHAPLGADRFEDKNDRFWALKDLSFDIEQGDRVGIIGRNGAGKSTLLKILSRITAPSEGKVMLKGRVASLLEVGTGFHGELTGRENVYLNGAILGMKKREIDRKIDEIIAFSEISQHIDTPVKRYSSGMYVRLAFAVAAHLDSEILIADEVLAVGDAEFQKKCIGKMDDMSKEQGRTILFVSHNMNFIEDLCEKAIRLERGRAIDTMIDTHDAVIAYLGLGGDDSVTEWLNPGSDYDAPEFRPTRFALVDASGSRLAMPVSSEKDIFVELSFEVEDPNPLLTVGYAIYSDEWKLLYWSYQSDTAQDDWPLLHAGSNKIRSPFPRHLLNEGKYHIALLSSIHFQKWLVDPEKDAPRLDLWIQGGLSQSPYWQAKRPGIMAPICKWEALP